MLYFCCLRCNFLMQSFFTQDPEQRAAFLSDFTTPQRVAIITHQQPDGDAMGSSLGFQAILTELGHHAQVITPTAYPDFLGWMPGISGSLSFEGPQQEAALITLADADWIFILDLSSPSRVKGLEPHLKNAKGKVLLVDHHEEPTLRADFIFWDQHAAATCQLIFELVRALEWLPALNQTAAQCLYVGLLTDTGSFRFPSTIPAVHEAAGYFLSLGVSPSLTYRRLFDTQRLGRLRLTGYALAEKLQYLPEYRVAYFAFTREELNRFSSQQGDTEGLVNYGLSIEGAVMSVIFVEKDDMIKMSFRSVDSFSVSALARDHFEGGGHHNAAGGRSRLSLDETIQKFLNLLPVYQADLLAQPWLKEAGF